MKKHKYKIFISIVCLSFSIQIFLKNKEVSILEKVCQDLLSELSEEKDENLNLMIKTIELQDKHINGLEKNFNSQKEN